MTVSDGESKRTDGKIKVGISACLLGQMVRFDGSHKRNSFVMNHLDQHFTWHGVCPEVESGMGTPRPTIRLVNDTGELKVMRADGTDVTEQLSNQVTRSVSSLQNRGIRAILKKDSPSCGMERVRVYTKGSPTRNSQGVFARHSWKRCLTYPLKTRPLNDPRLRENFMLRVFARPMVHLPRDPRDAAGSERFHLNTNFSCVP